MKTWFLSCSIDGVNIDFDMIILSEKEPDFYECEKIAHDHDCKYWTIDTF